VNTATAPSAPQLSGAAAVVIGGDPLLRRRAAALLTAADFTVGDDPSPDALIVLLGTGTETERLREIRELVARHPGADILAVVPEGVPHASLRRALLAGAGGIVLENELEAALAASARATLAGQLAVPRALSRQIAPRPLSHREKEILALMVLGLTNRQIADKLYLAESTVKTHVSAAFRKLDVRSRAEAVARIEDPDAGYGPGILALAGKVAA
jgi:DNA-binding NarL/FixJ family response regulator